MALLFMDGFDHYDPGDEAQSLTKWDRSDVAHTTVTGRGGSGNAISLNAAGDYLTKALPDPEVLNATIGFACYLTANISVLNHLINFGDYNGAETQLAFKLNPSNQVVAYNQFTAIGTSGTALPVGEWFYLEFYGLIHQTAGAYEVRLNGVDILSASSVDTMGTVGGLANLQLEGQADDIYIDDLYILNDTGSSNTSFLGDVQVATVYPDSDVTNDMTAVGTGTTNADRVDEVAADGDTTYVHSTTVGHQERYGYGALPSDVGVVHGVQVIPLAKKADGGVRTARATAYSVATEAVGATVGLGSAYHYHPHIFEQDPDAVAAWTKTTVDAASFGFEIVA